MSSALEEEEVYTGEVLSRKQIKRNFTGKVEWNLPKPSEFTELPSKIQKKDASSVPTARIEKQTRSDSDRTESSDNLVVQKRTATVTIAVPTSMIDLCLILELKSILAGQISRIAALYQIDEIVVYKDLEPKDKKQIRSDELFSKILQYQETPQYVVYPNLEYSLPQILEKAVLPLLQGAPVRRPAGPSGDPSSPSQDRVPSLSRGYCDKHNDLRQRQGLYGRRRPRQGISSL